MKISEFERTVLKFVTSTLGSFEERNEKIPPQILGFLGELHKNSSGDCKTRLGGLISFYDDDEMKWPEEIQETSRTVRNIIQENPNVTPEQFVDLLKKKGKK